MRVLFAGGSYIVVTSSRSSEGHAMLISPPVSAAPGDRQCLTFWWSTSVQSVLSVRLLRHDGVLLGIAWNQTGNPGAWTQANVNIVTQGPFQVSVCSCCK